MNKLIELFVNKLEIVKKEKIIIIIKWIVYLTWWEIKIEYILFLLPQNDSM
jgi:hypothetical protein